MSGKGRATKECFKWRPVFGNGVVLGNAVSIQCEHSFSVFLQKLAGRVA